MDRVFVGEWGLDEHRALVAALLRGRQDHGPEMGALKARLETIYRGRPLLFISRGRHAIELALRAFAERQPGRTEVVFPAYICPSVIEAIERAGLAPVAADIRDDLNIDPARVKARLSSRTLAVIVADMYGCPAPVAEIERICRSRGIFLLDDAAQACGISIGDRIAGCYGDCGLVSFSFSKTVVAGAVNAGAFLIVNRPELEPSLRARWDRLPPPVYSWANFFNFLEVGAFDALASPLSYYLGQIRRRLGSAAREPSARQYPPQQMANANAVVALRQLDSMPARLSGRIRTTAMFQEQLTQRGLASVAQFAPGRYLTRVLARLSCGQDLPSLRRRLRRQGVRTRLPYAVDRRYADGSPRAIDLSARMIELPSHSRMTERAVRRIVAGLAACLSERGSPLAAPERPTLDA